MIKKLVRHGNSLALVIDKAILDLLRIDHDTPLELITDGDVIIIKPERDEEVSDEIRAVHEEMAARYGKVFERLAK
ncbi:MAG TPA: AbrB/MazE/SpoVT family DNA-binding domain-containing protein [Candidatus Hydrogenedentes bacterium]|nr:AbrB/MazE/SpoVT family DNA-binding domain-containing protein [Candidatus Hydrogenedentota bacterium]NLT59459.1 AbrB/MazE/SpoVT family DNA-binding domain-containing protein [Candidatus Hydrogenedentota bacterium]HNZ19932.1 AbrB/MazE/SpoVT family DNA-binding domain-containing protein [Candidatus Hydrogenedentota bacterium]HOH35402.1 AbrB/MazE/SpoVT family DNA-binding domain-containing protein [Candidatus Hydrogenedentota bacterium]HPA06689.1 AbrB/MazE/SpoVT family DNA-binding domain-containing